MRIAALCAIIVTLGLCLVAGCGGGNGTTNPSSFVVTIQNDRVVPKFDTVGVNDTIQFVNSSGTPQQVVSGTLAPQGSPLVIHQIVIGNTGFTPTLTQANLGDTIRFSNNSFNTFVLQIVDDNGQVVSSLTLPVGNQQDFPFSTAGEYTVRSAGNSLFQAKVILFGRPTPNGLFQSPVLNNGGVFSRQFTVAGSFPYFIQNQNNPNQSFITGTVTVQ